MAIGFPVLSSSYSGSAFHSGAAPYRSAEPVTPVTLTPEEHAKAVTVECGGRAYTYDAAGNHIGTDVEVTAAPMPPHPDDIRAGLAVMQDRHAAMVAAHEVAPLSPAADATFEAWEQLPVTDPRTIEEYAAEPDRDPQPIPARSSAWHRGLAKVRALVPK